MYWKFSVSTLIALCKLDLHQHIPFMALLLSQKPQSQHSRLCSYQEAHFAAALLIMNWI